MFHDEDARRYNAVTKTLQIFIYLLLNDFYKL